MLLTCTLIMPSGLVLCYSSFTKNVALFWGDNFMDIDTREHQGQVIAQYRKIKNWSQQDLADVLRVNLSTIQRMEKQAVIKNIERRKFLVGILGIPAALLGIQLKEQNAKIDNFPLNNDRMAFFEEQLSIYWEVYHSGNTARISQGINLWLNESVKFAREARNTTWNHRALTLLALSYQLQGSAARDQMKYNDALNSYKKTFEMAQELDDLELIAVSLARIGVACLQKDNPNKAIEYLQSALDTAKYLGLPRLNGYIYQGLSEAYAKSHQYQQSHRAIGMAEVIASRLGQQSEKNQVRFSQGSVQAQRGVDAVLLGEYDRAISTIDKSLPLYDPTMNRGKARLLAQKAEAYLGLGIIDASTTIAEESLILAKTIGSQKTIQRITALYNRILDTRFRKEPCVARLGALLSI
jgi:tetratricopeptide (TPR) repeat protein